MGGFGNILPGSAQPAFFCAVGELCHLVADAIAE